MTVMCHITVIREDEQVDLVPLGTSLWWCWTMFRRYWRWISFFIESANC